MDIARKQYNDTAVFSNHTVPKLRHVSQFLDIYVHPFAPRPFSNSILQNKENKTHPNLQLLLLLLRYLALFPHPLRPWRRLKCIHNQQRHPRHAQRANSIRNLPPGPPIDTRKQHRPQSPPQLSPAPQHAQLSPALALVRLKAAEGIQTRDYRRRGGSEQGSCPVEAKDRRDAAQHDESQETSDDADPHRKQRG